VDVLSIDTDSRAAPPSEAYQRVKRVASAVVAAGFRNIYKSLDSTLRGNLGAEIDAVLDVFDAQLAIVAPAFPFYGRTTVGGKHFLNGRLITQTEFGTDPQAPVKEADLVRLFSLQSRRKAGLVQLSTLRQGNTAVAAQLTALVSQGVELVVFDAQVEADLDRIAGAVGASGYRPLWVGSTGLARCIPGAAGLVVQEGLKLRHFSSTHLAMLVLGSASEVTRNQLATLKTQCDVIAVEMNPFHVVAGGDAAANEMERCCIRLVDALRNGNDAVLHVSSSRADVTAAKSLGLEMGLDPIQVSTHIVVALAHITRLVVDTCELRGIILTGGDTAKAVCNQLGSMGIEIWEEVEPGIPLGRLVGDHELLVITKAGGFGTPQALVNSLDALKRND
jgi:uncharacterized protein YgbK (DUF1537 family)